MNRIAHEKLDDFLAALRKRVRGEVRTDAVSKVLYSTDASIYQVEPLGVLLPREEEDVHAAVALAHEFAIPLLPRTSGSSLAGQAVNAALVVDFTRHLDALIEVNAEEKWARVQPGIVLDELNRLLQPHGLMFGPDPASSNRAAMGGIVSNNSTGSHSILYGMSADHVLATRVLLSDGSEADFSALNPDELARKRRAPGLEGRVYEEIAGIAEANADVIRAGTPKHWRRCGGYNLDRFIDGCTYRGPVQPGFNLAKLICGSEGGLAVINEIKLNLVELPARTALAIVHFDSLYEALEATQVILEVEPSAAELLDHLGLRLCRDVPAYARMLKTFLKGDPNCVLITEFYGTSEKELRGRIEGLEQHLRTRGVRCEIVPALDAQTQANVWAVRKAGLGLMMSIKGDYKPVPFIEDAAVPVTHLAEYVTRIEKFCNDLGNKVAYYAHASAGCIHIRPLLDLKQGPEVGKLEKIGRFAADLLGGYGGSLSSEHGDGRCRSWLNRYFYGEELYGLYERVKKTFDPANILNPGAVIATQHIHENLRFGPEYRAQQIQTAYDFTTDQGFDRAVEMCNGAGVCRKTSNGAMCPSFMATREEEHSTRGRANALRAALTGKVPSLDLHSRRLYEVMDLCVECKACKAECPSSVDMAKIKFEFLAGYNQANGTPRRSKLFGKIAKISRLASGPQAAIVNRIGALGAMRSLNQSLLGISRQRDLPAFATRPFTRWHRERQPAANGRTSTGEVVLFHDTFNTYNEPEVAIAAYQLLERCGLTVHVPGHFCCGRPLISKGLASEAREAARATVDKLYPFAEKGIPIVGLEPSCLLTFRDEYLYMLPNDPKAKAVAEHSYMIEEFLPEFLAGNQIELEWGDSPERVLLHGHCHQKAVTGTAPMHAFLSLVPGLDVEEVDSSCCGMAGSFGYEAEHYEISMKMAERRLLPAVREAGISTEVAAPGFSCRHQIRHGAERDVRHPVEIVAAALQDDLMGK